MFEKMFQKMLNKNPGIVYAACIMSKTTDDALIEVVPVRHRSETLRMLHLSPAQVTQLTVAASEGKIDMGGLFRARRGRTLVGVGWGQVLAGNTAFCWPPCLIAGERSGTAAKLQQMVDRYLDSAGVLVSQAIITDSSDDDTSCLVQAGYQHLAILAYMVAKLETHAPAPPTEPLAFVPIGQPTEPDLGALVEQTYAGTLDCPALETTRTTQDVLTGYRETGTYRPEWWLCVQHAGRDVGCLILADHPARCQAELVYLGLIPEVRGAGWGLTLARYALWLAGQADREKVVLAVDEANWPALQMYEQVGFRIWDRRHVFVRT